MTRDCPGCGAPCRTGFRFCPACGKALDSPRRSGGAPSAGQAARAPQQNIRKHVTALFCDLSGSTELVADADPEDAQARLDVALRVMTGGIVYYGGTLVQVLGDGLFAAFGAPVAQEDHAVRACLAARSILSAAARAANPETMRIRIGIDSGEIVFGPADGSPGANFRADGATIHLAARLEQLARAGTAVLSGNTCRLVHGRIPVRALGRHPIRGFKNAIDLYELGTDAAVPLPSPEVLREVLEPIVGRDKLLARLGQMATDVRAGMRQAAAAGLLGEAGIGKSRVIAEMRRRLDAAGFDIHVVQASSYNAQVAFSLVGELFREFLGVSTRIDPVAMREACRQAVAALPREFAAHRDAVTDILDLGRPDDAWETMQPPQRRRAIVKALAWFIARRVAASPTLLVIEDIHLSDGDSLRALDAALAQFADQPLLLYMSYRPGFRSPLKSLSSFTEIAVGPIAADQMESLARTVLGEDPSLAALIPSLLSRADGNPFFLEQLVLNLADEGKLTGTRGHYRLVGKPGRWRVPGSIASVISARFDHLPAEARAAAEAAAVLGEQITRGVVAAMLETDEARAAEALEHAVAAGLMARPAQGESIYTFTHSLVREAIGECLTRQARQRLHRQACKSLLSQHGGDVDAVAARVLRHAYEGESWLETVDFALRAMSRAIARSANRDALRIFETGLEAAAKVPDEPTMARRELALRIKALSVLLPLNRIDDGIANLGHAERLANLTGDHRRLAAMRVQLAVIQWTLGRYETGIESAHSAATAAILARDRNMEMAAAQARLMLLHAQGHYSEVVATARRISRRFATELARRELIPGWAIMASIGVRVFLADSLARLGNLSGAQRALDASYRELSHHQHAFSRVLTDFIQATHWMDLERFEEAAILLAAAAESCRTHDLTTMYPPVIAAMGGAMARAGRVEAGLALLEEAHRDGIHRQGGRYNEVYLPANLGIALSLAGRHTEALGFMQVALDSASTLGQAGHRADTLRLMGELRERAGDPEGAVASYQECRRAALACGMARVAADAARRLTGLRSNPPSRRGARHAEKA